MTNRKIIVVACIVNIWLYASALRILLSGDASCSRISSASTPPIRKKQKAVAPYMRPSFLWSTVKIQLRQPVVDTGRLKTPSDVLGVTTVDDPRARAGVSGRSAIAI